MKFTTWKIPREVIVQTQSAFRRGNHEVFAMWTSALGSTEQDCAIRRCVIPGQTPGISPHGGVFVHIPGHELSRIQVDNYSRGERNVIQLRTHPSADVRMSGLDREWEVVKHDGALSIIVPSYCHAPLEGFKGVNVYERIGLDWRLWSNKEISERLKVI